MVTRLNFSCSCPADLQEIENWLYAYDDQFPCRANEEWEIHRMVSHFDGSTFHTMYIDNPRMSRMFQDRFHYYVEFVV